MSKCEVLVATPQLRWQQRDKDFYTLQQYWSDPLGVSGVSGVMFLLLMLSHAVNR